MRLVRWMILTGWLFIPVMAFATSAKNLIWIIADGTGPEIMGLLMQGARAGALADYPQKTTALEQLLQDGEQGLFFHHTHGSVVTDSAAAATQMATGAWTLPDRVGVDYQENPVPTLLEIARQKGKAIGIVSDAYVTDATPAGFTAHVLSRRQKMEIARQQLALAPEVILGGGRKYFSTGENKNLLTQARAQGYQLPKNKKALQKIHSGKVLGLFSDTNLPMAVEMYQHPTVPALPDMTEQALEILAQDPDGFILITEAGKVDWAAHANDAGGTLAELKVLDKTISVARKFAEKHPGTLVYVNSDHDTGLGSFTYQTLTPQGVARKTQEGEVLYDGNTFYASFDTFTKLEKQRRCLYYLEEELKKLPPEKLTPALVEKKLRAALGYPVDISGFENLQDVPGIFKQLNDSYAIVWATQTHSSAPLIGVAYGPGQEMFKGVYHNTDILPKLKKVLGWSEE